MCTLIDGRTLVRLEAPGPSTEEFECRYPSEATIAGRRVVLASLRSRGPSTPTDRTPSRIIIFSEDVFHI